MNANVDFVEIGEFKKKVTSSRESAIEFLKHLGVIDASGNYRELIGSDTEDATSYPLDVLSDALQDAIHLNKGKVRVAKSVKVRNQDIVAYWKKAQSIDELIEWTISVVNLLGVNLNGHEFESEFRDDLRDAFFRAAEILNEE